MVEVLSPESAHRDRTVKLRKYAEAGIASYRWVEEEDGLPVVHTYELDGFEISLELDKLVPSRG